jgi:hypothetical protein
MEVLIMKNILVIGLIALLVSPVLANPPSNIIASYDNATHFLTIQVMHATFAPAYHYIKQVIVNQNGEKLLEQNFNSQLNKKEQDVIFITPDLKPGVSIEVTGKCSLFGEKTKQFTL